MPPLPPKTTLIIRPQTLPDLLAEGLMVVFIGINPGLYSAAQGHYFARKTNRFWPALSQSRLGAAAKAALGVERLEPRHDRLLPALGFGFTDLVKRPTANATELTRSEFEAAAPILKERLEWARPRLVCFHGITAYAPFRRRVFDLTEKPGLGLQAERLGPAKIFLAPNPSPANGHFTLADQIFWYDRIAEVLNLLA
jgi:double-stranded uracil-DNA glycosylase